MNVGLMCIAKDEEKYLDEFFEYHFNLGFDYIFLIDNNTSENKYIPKNNYNNRLIIHYENDIDIRNQAVHILYTRCSVFCVSKYNIDYLTIIDADEFISLKYHNDIKSFIIQEMINKNRDIIEIQWETYDDNNIIYEKDEGDSVIKAYTNIIKKHSDKWNNIDDELSFSKCIFKYKFERLSPHGPFDYRYYIEFVNDNDENYIKNRIPNEVAVINHYRTKCLESYLRHKILINKTDQTLFTKNGDYILGRYFEFNKITKEKILAARDLCEKYNISLSENDKKLLNDNDNIQ